MALAHGKTIRARRTQTTKAVVMAEPRTRSRKTCSLSDDVAEDRFHYKNQLCMELKNAHPHKPFYWHVDKFYPMAAGGPLYVDEPRTDYDMDAAKEKQKIMTKAGHRFVVITASMSIDDVINQTIEVKA